MYYGKVAEREIPKTEAEKANLVKKMVSELLDECLPIFDTTTFIVHEMEGKLTVGMKWVIS